MDSLARALGINPSAVAQWERVPAERIVQIERLTNVPRNVLRPDLYPQPKDN
jgi:DNA-binding transcriptional regulator YdaS (Cro superfamily)